MSTSFQIIADKCVYFHSRKMFYFEAATKKPRALLQGKPKDSIFDALYKGIAEKWLVRDDVIKPFGDKRQNLRFLPLARLREPGSDPILRSEFTPFKITPPPKQDLTSFPPPYQNPATCVSTRRLALCSRLLSDFADQWRHILRPSYAESTFRILAKAVISLATCEFQVEELFTRQHIFGTGPYVSTINLPTWEPHKRCIVGVNGTTVIVHQDLQAAMKIAEDDTSEIKKSGNATAYTEQRRHLLLSVRHILLCYVDVAGKFSYTAPTSLIDGLNLPSPSAINLLLQALSPARPLGRTPLHTLPLEIQDRILRQVSEGPVEAARLGCVLGLGSAFSWKREIDGPRRHGSIELLYTGSHRYECSPVESKICFGDVFSGVSYR